MDKQVTYRCVENYQHKISRKDVLCILRDSMYLISEDYERFICTAIARSVCERENIKVQVYHSEALNIVPELKRFKPDFVDSGYGWVGYPMNSKNQKKRIEVLNELIEIYEDGNI